MAAFRDRKRAARYAAQAARPPLSAVEAPPRRALDLSLVRFELDGPREHGGDDYEPATDHNYRLRALYEDEAIGELDLDAEPGRRHLHVRWVEVQPDLQRQGLGSLLIQEAQRRWPGRELETNGFTDQGQEFWAAKPWRRQLEHAPANDVEPTLDLS